VEEWTQKLLRVAPRSMKNGFFISELQFYDLQDHLMSESVLSVLVAAGICSLVLYVATRNLVVTLLAAMCVSATVLTSLAVLALLDWRLNILESLAVTMASGLSLDYVLHYAIKFNAHLERDLRIKYLVHKNLSPIAIATLTTLSTGLLLLTSDVLAFNQLGTFIAILSVNSFIFSNLGFLSLLVKFGPSYETDLEFCRGVWTVSELQDEANITSQVPLNLNVLLASY
jgi:predicted RND superfamily exporter protein